MPETTPPVRISVVIPHYQDLANLAICLDRLDRQTLPRAEREIIVADNMSPAGLDAVAAIIAGRARLVCAPEKGAGPARNAGAALASGEAIAFLDSDCRPEPEWLASALEALATHPLIGGHVSVSVADPAAKTAAEAFEAVFAFDNARYIREEGFSVSANLIMRRAVWQAVGGFRPAVSEDVDWCHRARQAGFPVAYAPAVRIAHPARTTFAELRRKWQRLTKEAFLLMRETPFGTLKWLVRTWIVGLSPLFHIPKVLASPALDTNRDRINAIAALFAIRWFRCAQGHKVWWEYKRYGRTAGGLSTGGDHSAGNKDRI